MVRRLLCTTVVLAGCVVSCYAAAEHSARAATDDADRSITELYSKKKLFGWNQYKAVRAVFASRFEQSQSTAIRQGFGDDYDAMMEWLDAHRDIKEELFTAINEEYDEIPVVLKLFKEIKQQFPEKIVLYSNLAIATAVTWDNSGRGGNEFGNGVYEYQPVQRRTRSTMPDGRTGAIESFRYVAENEAIMQGRGQHLPWEILSFVINDRTPIPERQWAVENYVAKRAMIGKCYKDVPYDYEMLYRDKPKLAGHEYTLANVRQFGGVCANQADYAARVGKSLGVPAAYVFGPGTTGISHAWVMWVEIKQVTPKQTACTLESFGRYNLDHYYVGQLADPQTAQLITDRDMELRLVSVSADWQAKRHADLIMRAYPTIRDDLKLSVPDQLKFLDNCITLCPYNEACWVSMAKLSKDGTLQRTQIAALMTCLNKLFTTFARYPDFTWKVFDDLITVQSDFTQRTKLYERLIGMYEAAERPDLACQARLKLSEYQADAKKWKDAADGLADTVRKYPSEGRYVPALVDQLDKVSREIKDGNTLLVRFYTELLPKIPQKRGELVSPYCVAMYERAIKLFRESGRTKEADSIAAELAKIKSSTTAKS